MKRFLLVSLLSAGTGSAQAPPGSLLEREIAWADYYAREFAVPAELVAAVIDVESAWQPAVVSPKGAAGLMQLMPATAYRFGVTNRFRIEENIRGGVTLMSNKLGLYVFVNNLFDKRFYVFGSSGAFGVSIFGGGAANTT